MKAKEGILLDQQGRRMDRRKNPGVQHGFARWSSGFWVVRQIPPLVGIPLMLLLLPLVLFLLAIVGVILSVSWLLGSRLSFRSLRGQLNRRRRP